MGNSLYLCNDANTNVLNKRYIDQLIENGNFYENVPE